MTWLDSRRGRRDEAHAADRHVRDGPARADAGEAILHGNLALPGGQDLRPDAGGGLVDRLPEVDDPIARVGLDPFHMRLFEPPP